jgi:thiol-disulfide isomerase/thioredoxin
MKYITGIIIILCLHQNVYAQKTDIDPFYIGDRIPDLPLHRIINYKDSTATLSSFGDKLVVLSFWSTYCKSCIELFGFEDSLQRVNNDKLQIILVTMDPKEKVLPFIKRYNQDRQTKLSLPLIYGDSVLAYLFRHHSVPHYAWLAPGGQLLGQTGSEYMNVPTLEYIAREVFYQQQKLYKYHISEVMMHYPKAPDSFVKAMQANCLEKKE